MVLAAMLKESVMKKAREEGRREAREELLKRWNDAFDRFGVEVDGVLMLPWTPEVERFLRGEPKA